MSRHFCLKAFWVFLLQFVVCSLFRFYLGDATASIFSIVPRAFLSGAVVVSGVLWLLTSYALFARR